MAIKLSPLFFWIEPIKKIFWDSFGWVFIFLFILWVPFLRVWWWIFLPIMLADKLRELYLWWIDWDFTYAKLKWVVLEITPPRETMVPVKAMEDVFSIVWTIWDGANWRELWCEGELNYVPFWCSWEIVSIEGRIHFYLRVLSQHRNTIENALFAYYPEIEIKEVPDYVKLVPPTVPNEEWDIYGEDYILANDEVLPIKTYEKFFEPQGEKISAEEKRMDPLISLLEGLSRLGPGENFWVQFIAMPMAKSDEPSFIKNATSYINKISKRPEKKNMTFWEELIYWINQIIFGPEKEGAGESAKYKWTPMQKEESGEREMILTPGEREIITEVENKAKKALFKTVIRGVYVAKRENWKSSHKVLARAYLSHFSTQNMNRIQFNAATRPKVHYIMRQRRTFIRARKLFRMAVLRLTPGFPDRKKFSSIYSTEEMATLFHFPLRITGMVYPTMSKIESKKAGPPPNLPIE